MHTARKLEIRQNLFLDDLKLRQSQISARRHNTQNYTTHPSPKLGDTITNLSPQPKHTTRDMYLVTAATHETVTAQKILPSAFSGVYKNNEQTIHNTSQTH